MCEPISRWGQTKASKNWSHFITNWEQTCRRSNSEQLCKYPVAVGNVEAAVAVWGIKSAGAKHWKTHFDLSFNLDNTTRSNTQINMKFLVVFFFAATMMTATVMSQTTTTTESAIDYLIDEIEDELNDYTSSSSPSSTSDYYSTYSTPDYYSSYYSDYDDTTTVKPFKQQLLSLFFNKKAGLSGK